MSGERYVGERDRERGQRERERERERGSTVEPPKAGTHIQRAMWKILSVRRKICWRERERERETETERETERHREREREGSTVEPPKAGTQIQRAMWKILSVRRKICWRERHRERERQRERQTERQRDRETERGYSRAAQSRYTVTAGNVEDT